MRGKFDNLYQFYFYNQWQSYIICKKKPLKHYVIYVITI